jgi:hypothetical protein
MRVPASLPRTRQVAHARGGLMIARFLAVALSLVALAPVAGASSTATARNVKIAASTPAKWAISGDRVAITGKVTPHAAGIEVTLEQRGDFGWNAIEDASVRADGAFKFTARPTKLGLTTYRVVTTKGTGFLGASARVPLRVLHWEYLTDVEAFAYVLPISGGLDKAPISANKVLYQHPFSLFAGCYNQWSGSSWIDLPLEQRFEMFTATVSMSDNAGAGSTSTYSLIGGGKKLASGSLALGETKQIKVSLDGIYRLRITTNVPDPTNAGGCAGDYTKVVFGDAKVLGP